MKTKYYDAEDIENYKAWETEVELGKKLREKYGIIIMRHTASYVENTFSLDCPNCKTRIKGTFGRYDKPLTQGKVECPNGALDEGHGWWASVLNLILN